MTLAEKLILCTLGGHIERLLKNAKYVMLEFYMLYEYFVVLRKEIYMCGLL